MPDSAGRQTLRLALAAALAGFAWEYVRRRAHPRRTVLALTRGAAWFIACGGAAVLVEALRGGLAGDDSEATEVTERVTHASQTVTDRGARRHG